MRCLLLTGADGFVGRYLLEGLEDYQVVPMRRTPSGGLGEIALDLSRFESMDLRPVDIVVHTAATMDSTDPAAIQAINVDATKRLIEWSISAGASQFLLISSGAVYGPSPEPRDEASPRAGTSAYARSKIQAEDAVFDFQDRILVQVARLYFPYGPGQVGRFLPNLILRILREEPIDVDDDGGPMLSLTYISDLVMALRLLIGSELAGAVNIAGPESLSVSSIAASIASETGKRVTLSKRASGKDANFLADTRRIRDEIGFQPSLGLSSGLREVLRKLER